MANCPGNILVVDDDMAHRTMLVTLLGGWGYATAEADDGALAVSAVRPSGTTMLVISSVCPSSVARHFPLAMFHTRIARSIPPEIARSPPGQRETALTPSS